ncbi:MAG: DUF2220 family protein [Eubacteriales bacterium]
MNLQTKILEDLIKKYEKSKHLRSPNQSNRRVFLSKEKGELKGYQWESVSSLALFADEAQFLEKEELIAIQWEVAGRVLAQVSLNLQNIEKSYGLLGKNPPWVEAEAAVTLLCGSLQGLCCPWLIKWREDAVESIETTWKLPSFFKKGVDYVENLCLLLVAFDKFPEGGMTLRSFSVQVFHNSKDLEQVYLDDFLKILREYHPELSELWKETHLSDKEILQLVGLTPRGELFQLSGDIVLEFPHGFLDVGVVGACGLALTAESCKNITKIQMNQVKELYFIENKTNYDAFVLLRKEDQAVIYHGGFFSPSKGAFFQKFLPYVENRTVYFWGDIDMGGFSMYKRLHGVFSNLAPYCMGKEEVLLYGNLGLKRNDEYLAKLEEVQGGFPEFEEVITEILRLGVTIEQEVML